MQENLEELYEPAELADKNETGGEEEAGAEALSILDILESIFWRQDTIARVQVRKIMAEIDTSESLMLDMDEEEEDTDFDVEVKVAEEKKKQTKNNHTNTHSPP